MTGRMYNRMGFIEKVLLGILLGVFFIQYSCAPKKYLQDSAPFKGEVQIGVASWYGSDFHGRKTSSGEVYNMHDMTAAHRTLPLGTHVRVTNLENGKSTDVRINDRGPFVKRRIIDLSYAGAQALDMVDSGIAMVKVEVTKRPKQSVSQYTLQVGSFKEKKNAVLLKEELDKRYKDIYIVTTKIENSDYYRVRLGYFSSRESAQKMARRLTEDGYTVFTTRRD